MEPPCDCERVGVAVLAKQEKDPRKGKIKHHEVRVLRGTLLVSLDNVKFVRDRMTGWGAVGVGKSKTKARAKVETKAEATAEAKVEAKAVATTESKERV